MLRERVFALVRVIMTNGLWIGGGIWMLDSDFIGAICGARYSVCAALCRLGFLAPSERWTTNSKKSLDTYLHQVVTISKFNQTAGFVICTRSTIYSSRVGLPSPSRRISHHPLMDFTLSPEPEEPVNVTQRISDDVAHGCLYGHFFCLYNLH
jgi:hypothetical protein